MVANAAWGSSDPFAKFTSESAFTGSFAMPTDGKLQINQNNQAVSSNSQVNDMTSPEIDISGLTGETGYNTGKWCASTTWQLPTTNQDNADPMVWRVLDQNSQQYDWNTQLIYNGGQNLWTIGYNSPMGGSFLTSTIPDSYGGSWLQLYMGCSPNSSDYVNWTGGSGWNYYIRFAVIDLATNTVLLSEDTGSNSTTNLDYATMFNTTDISVIYPYNTAADSFWFNQRGGFNSQHLWAGGAVWLGHHWDIQQSYSDGMNRVWCSGTINGGKSWFNCYNTGSPVAVAYGTGTYMYYLPTTGTDRYSESNNYQAQVSFSKTPSEWSTIYTTTNLPEGKLL